MDKYAVLVFHGQHITDEQQMAFALPLASAGNAAAHRQAAGLRLSTGSTTSQPGKDGKPPPPDSRVHLSTRQRLWHSDFRSAIRQSPRCPRAWSTKGGNTEFADMRAGCDALDEDQGEIEDTICEHSPM